MDYLLIASILVFAGMVQLFGKSNISIPFSAAVVTVVPFLLRAFIKWILLSGQSPSVFQVVTVQDVITLLVQFAAALWIFRILRQNEESIGGWFAWVVAGGLIIYFVVPFLTNNVPLLR